MATSAPAQTETMEPEIELVEIQPPEQRGSEIVEDTRTDQPGRNA